MCGGLQWVILYSWTILSHFEMANFILKIAIVFWNSSKSFDTYPSLNDAKTSSGIVMLIILGREKREERLRISMKGLKGGTNLFCELNFSQQALPLQLITRAVWLLAFRLWELNSNIRVQHGCQKIHAAGCETLFYASIFLIWACFDPR